MKNTRKTLLAVLGVVLAVALVIGGTLAYLQDISEKKVNTFVKNTVEVDLTENDNNYSIIPGSSQTKDPKVTVNTTLPSYVFLVVEDETDGLVTYEIDDTVWTPLSGNVYYKTLDDAVSNEKLNVLKGEKVTYAVNITNGMMGDTTIPAKLSFTSYVIQKSEAFADAAAAWNAIVDLPVSAATMTTLDLTTSPVSVTDLDSGWNGNLNTAVKFSTSDTSETIVNETYKNYPVDFILTFNKEIADTSKVHLFGQYDGYSPDWIGEDLNTLGITSLNAGEKVQVVASMLPGNTIPYSYVVSTVQNFQCGIAVEDGALGSGVENTGLTATLQLVMIDEYGAVHVLSEQSFDLG